MSLDNILEINNKLKAPFEGLSFYEPTHVYSVEGHEGREIKSVSSLLKYFYVPFDTDNMAVKWAKDRNLPVDWVKKSWEGEGLISTTHGTKVHLVGEDYVKHKFLGEKFCPEPFDKQSLGAIQFINDLPDYLVPVAVELQMYNEPFWYCGTCDGVLYNTNNGKYIIYDYKGLPLDTPIFTGEGWKTMGTLTEEDQVYDRGGNLVNIKHVSNIKNKRCIKLTFDNGEEIVSDYEHRWLIHSLNSREGYILTSQEILDYSKISEVSNLRIDNPLPIKNPEIDLPMDPKLIGEIFALGTQVEGYDDSLPELCLKGSLKQRENFMKGVFKTLKQEAHLSNKIEIPVNNTEKEQTIVKMLGSMGIPSEVIHKDDIWEVHFWWFKIHKKIVKVEEVDSVPTKCIEVDSPTHTYLFGHSFTVTHNTNKTLTGLYGKIPLIGLPPEYGLLQNNFGKYSLQFSFYQILLESIGVEVQSRVLVHLEEDKKNKKLYKTYKTKDVTKDLLQWLDRGVHLNNVKNC